LRRAGCTTLLSEDMQDEAVVAGATVHNPFVGEVLPEPIAVLLA
jgi:predicted nucleic acid-binding protein